MVVIDFIGYNFISFIILKGLPFLLLGVLLFNLIQRKLIPGWGKKRLASFYWVLLITGYIAFTFLIYRFRLSDWLHVPLLLIFGFIGFVKRRYLFPFQWRCATCNKRLSLYRVFLKPDHFCKTCTVPVVKPELSPENNDTL